MVKSVTAFDVARRAGVSQPTVSRTLRNLPGTSPETKARVLAAARALGYVPSDAGRSLSRQRTQRVAVVSEALTNPYYPELVEPLRRQLATHGYRTVLLTDDAGGSSTSDLADGSYDGAILTTTLRRSTLPRDLTQHQIPHVLVNRLLDEAESSSCGVDNRAGAGAVADLLVDLGHVHIGSIQGPSTTSTGRERADGLVHGLRRRGMKLRRDMTRRADFSHDAGRAAALDLLTVTDRPTAIACGNDVLALGVLSAAAEIGLTVPRDLTVIGFDDISMAGWPLIGLTTATCDRDAMAQVAVNLLLDQIAGNPAAVERRVPVVLTLRRTHAEPAR